MGDTPPSDLFFWYDPFGSAPKNLLVTGSVKDDVIGWEDLATIQWGRERPQMIAMQNRIFSRAFVNAFTHQNLFIANLRKAGKLVKGYGLEKMQ